MMRINADTKIAALIKGHPDALETIVTLRPDFKKLRNPVLRKLMAGRTSIAMAAKIGGCAPKDFFRALAPLGFEAEASAEPATAASQPRPRFPEVDPAELVSLDVRGMLREGTDPLKLIQQTVKALRTGQVLRIINTFEPTPLIQLLNKQGFAAYVERLDENLVETYFYKQAEPDDLCVDAGSSDDWDALLARYAGQLIEADVRHLEMPGPMTTILETLDRLPPGKALFVHHKRVPVFLLSELKDRGYDHRIKERSDGQVKLLIFRKADD